MILCFFVSFFRSRLEYNHRDEYDMDTSYSSINEVYYDELEDNNISIPQQSSEEESSSSFDTNFDYNGPLSPNYYQQNLLPSHHSPYDYTKPQIFYENPVHEIHDYQITNDQRGQYVLRRQDINANLISTNNER